MTSKEKKTKEPVEETEKAEDQNQEETVEEPKDVPLEVVLTPLEALQEEVKKKDQELAEQKEDFLREKADLENFRKRLIKDKEDSIQFANQRLLKELVQINDNLDRALEAPKASLESLREGVEMIQKQFTAFLKNQKVEAIEAMGKPFDPNLHEVMTQLESEEHDENIVIQEYSKGYTLNGRILHSAKVVISKKPAVKEEDTEQPEETKEADKAE
ncbi:MAG: nucleotide exchange factor GrpE [Nitrospinaceae bacterium]|jgi:molecular chaperone GrpE|nr:nucleotide exchange factor GrpE [Nitrospina sp.]MBT5376117.1 nucleotide exchange factor GrpE [Nitrospinaceae bacterium]MBT5869383.1 nucleotide exchange factor GrpE [Nitrospinaceae bacterium]MBT6347151.1 nucleotide exchange factor GrpE [Nitrospina sp.]